MVDRPKCKKVIIVLGIASLLMGCRYDIEEELSPSNPSCNVTNIRYSTTIRTILSNYGCTGCHGGGIPSGNIRLETHAQVKRTADDGSLFGSINHLPGFSPMPKGSAKMNSCDIGTIKAWIDAGSPNN